MLTITRILLRGSSSDLLINYMDEFNQINQIVNDAIKDSSYITVLISSGVYIITSQKDSISKNGYSTTLDLIKIAQDVDT